jgi:hypothetical protein
MTWARARVRDADGLGGDGRERFGLLPLLHADNSVAAPKIKNALVKDLIEALIGGLSEATPVCRINQTA